MLWQLISLSQCQRLSLDLRLRTSLIETKNGGCITLFTERQQMANPYDATLIPLGQFSKVSFPNSRFAQTPIGNIDAGGTFRLDKGKTPEHLIKIDSNVLTDHSPDWIKLQFREQSLAE